MKLVLHGADSTFDRAGGSLKDATKTERASVYASYHAVVTVQHDGKVDDPGRPAR